MNLLDKPLAFVDLETTGATAAHDRITEVAIITWDGTNSTTWSQLINPETSIPGFIETLTGISNEMVVGAPKFAEVADEVSRRLEGHVFVAHNAKFDYGFLKNEFRRLGRDFRFPVFCTIQYSRRLYPQHKKHSLATLIERHGLQVEARHRALADTQAIFDFWCLVENEFDAAHLHKVKNELLARPSLPPNIDPELLDDLPETHGVYFFYGENDCPIYVGKSNNLKKRVLSHFSVGHADTKEPGIAQQVRRIDWCECAGEIDALFTEAKLIEKLQPVVNLQLRRNRDLCSWELQDLGGEILKPELVYARDLDWAMRPKLYGMFNNPKEAKKALTELAKQNQLCLVTLGLEKQLSGSPCFARQLDRCAGACIGEETVIAHSSRLLQVLMKLRLLSWPFDGPGYLKEGDVVHVVENWCHIGTARNPEELEHVMLSGDPSFDKDSYQILAKHIRKLSAVYPY